MKEVDYREVYSSIYQVLISYKEITLATSYKDRVTSRTINFFCDNRDIYFITSKAYDKYKQILKNPSVALSNNQIQIEGSTEILGDPNGLNPNCYKKLIVNNESFKDYFKEYSKYKNSVLVKVSPRIIKLYLGRGSYYILDLNLKRAMSKGHKVADC